MSYLFLRSMELRKNIIERDFNRSCVLDISGIGCGPDNTRDFKIVLIMHIYRFTADGYLCPFLFKFKNQYLGLPIIKEFDLNGSLSYLLSYICHFTVHYIRAISYHC